MAQEVFVGADEGRSDVKDYTAKVALLVQKYLLTSTKVLVYSYKSTNTDSAPPGLL
jgi:hypothetical protein